MSESSRQRTTTIKARKKPRQKRSQAMVEKILSKTKDLLVRDGLRSLTTNRVADAAQISVGSLYQYFPNKVMHLYRLGVTAPTERIAIYGGKIPRTP